ncbi:MAG: ATP phosphoribosyltransferase regulatory subunit [Pseudanabaenaceae cyanobacterium]|jgi:ATP phosphoribosyltransferase regulatory subunit
MVHQLPTGAKDLLPLDVARKQWLEKHLQQCFHNWGYQRIITPTLEHLDSLTAGGAVQPETVLQLRTDGLASLGLRPELTASIARAYATRLQSDDGSCPQRLYYHANVFRRKGSHSAKIASEESFQAGVELLGAAGLLADGEILLLLRQCLAAVHLPSWRLVLGDARITNAFLATVPPSHRHRVHQCLADLDRVQIEQMDLPEPHKTNALALFDLRGNPETVLAKLQAQPWAQDIADEVDLLRARVDLWHKTLEPDALDPDAVSEAMDQRLCLDLSMIRTFDYYTGMVFEVISGNYVIAQGGRYDNLIGIYHPQGKTYPSVGFCLNLEDLQQVLLKYLPKTPQPVHTLVVPTSTDAVAAAFNYAQALRQQNPEAMIVVGLEAVSPEVAQSQAQQRGIDQVALVQGAESVQLLSVS